MKVEKESLYGKKVKVKMNIHIESSLPKELPARKKVKVIKRKFFWKESESENIRIESGLPKELFLQLERT